MAAIRTTMLGVTATGAMLVASPALAQIGAARAAEPLLQPDNRANVDQRAAGWWVRAGTMVRANHPNWRPDEVRTDYRFSVQHTVVAKTWLGIGAYSQSPRFDPTRGDVRDARHYAGARLSYEASGNVELGFAWMRRLRGKTPLTNQVAGGNRGIKPGPRAYMQLHF
jgi:hypothetical protein